MEPHQQRRRNRAPRVTIPNREQAVIVIGGKKLSGALCKLSINGGSLRLPRTIVESTLAEITLETTSGDIESAIQFLRPGAEGVQGFRFLQLDPGTRRQLAMAIEQMRKQGLGDGTSSVFQFCANAARRVVEKAKAGLNGE
jgi:hypothetical protein